MSFNSYRSSFAYREEVRQTREQEIIEGECHGVLPIKICAAMGKTQEAKNIISSDIGGFYPPSLPSLPLWKLK